LNATDKAPRDQDGESVVHRLKRNGADLVPGGLGHGVGRDVRSTGDHPEHCQSLSRHLDAALAQQICLIAGHEGPQ
jgi:hypothetical protein